jgi:hypothetical protein
VRKRRTQKGELSQSETAKDVLLRLLSVAQGSNFQMSAEMLDEIEAISIDGADPEWQISELKKILDRWVTEH